MKKILLLVSILTLTFSAFAQSSAEGHIKKASKIDYVIVEMKLGAILGGYKNGKFVDAETAGKAATEGEDYTLFGQNIGSIDGAIKVTKVIEPDLDFCSNYYAVKTNSTANLGVALSSNARWNATPRIPKTLNNNNRVYRGIVSKYLQSKGIKRPIVRIQKIVRVDLEGDGVDEVIIQATNRKGRVSHETKAGGYSIVLVRKIVKGKVNNILVGGDIVTKTRHTDIQNNFEVSSILDLDADGKMEVVLYGEYYEGAWATAYKIENGKSVKILETGCGA